MLLVRQVALNNLPLRNDPRSLNFGEEHIFILWQGESFMEQFEIFYNVSKWPVKYDRCIGKSMVVFNLRRKGNHYAKKLLLFNYL